MTTDKNDLLDSFNYEEERYLFEQIRMIQESYTKMIQPYVDRLARLQSLRPLPPTIVTLEQAQAMGLIK